MYVYEFVSPHLITLLHTYSQYQQKKKRKTKQSKKQLTHILSNKNMTDFAILHHFALLSCCENVGYTLAFIPSLLRITKMLQESSTLLSALRQRKLET